uniref:Uncharacterized protein n=1 Tax=Utricularia reniformis TaxID=192314 RepID=A0A1Y0B0U2_9LAMI|nr:hypothetical protein AEK19_MT0777 [Utricularia reniformis]ART31020.1 hypothetical protein AEK19_MT0777 [Utricularia reniformis]
MKDRFKYSARYLLGSNREEYALCSLLLLRYALMSRYWLASLSCSSLHFHSAVPNLFPYLDDRITR